jgi:hypothetical protein
MGVAMTENDIAEIDRIIKPLLGQRPWEVDLGVGSFITMQFGRLLPPEGVRKKSRGEWYLWVYCCAWRLERGQEVLAASQDPRPTLRLALRPIEGMAVDSITMSPPAGDTVIGFDGGYILRLFTEYSKQNESWMLFMPEGKVLVVGPGSSWTFEDSSGSRNSGGK